MPQRLMRVGQVSPWGFGDGRRGSRGGRGSGEVLRFVPVDLLRRLEERGGIDRSRSDRVYGIRPPKLGIVLGTMTVDPYSLMLLTMAKSFRKLGYALTVYAVNKGNAHLMWEKIGYQIIYLSIENISSIDWSIFDGIILSSLEANIIISSLVPEPFHTIPVIWIIHEDTLSKRLPLYKEKGWHKLISEWHDTFSRADVVIFPDFWLPMMYSALDSGNFFVIPGSPTDVWAVDMYIKAHSKDQLRKDIGLSENDITILIIGSSLFYDELPWDYTALMHVIGPQLSTSAQTMGFEKSFKFIFLCGNLSHGHDSAFQEIAAHLGFPRGSVLHYSSNNDVNKALMGADIVIYASFQDEQSFPSLLTRAMSFGIPILVPDLPIIKKYVVDKVNGLIYHAHNMETMTRAFSLLISDWELSELARTVGSYGKIMSKNMFAADCLTEYAKLLEKVVHFPSDTILPQPFWELQQHSWEWNLFESDIEAIGKNIVFEKFNENHVPMQTTGITFSKEDEFVEKYKVETPGNTTDVFEEDYPTESDWNEIGEIESSEDYERRENEELEERTEQTSGSWEYIYNAARKSEKRKIELNERDEGELERIGRSLCIYEIYDGEGAWPFLHHGTIYRGISLSRAVKRLRSDDIDAVERLPLLNDKFYKDILCEMGGMFSIANKIDNIHKIPWMGFQSWRTVGRKVSLSVEAEKVLERTIAEQTKGDVMYFWAKVELESEDGKEINNNDFWSVCDIINDGNCRKVFEDTFRNMYGLPEGTPALPPMPANGYWSWLHSWVMPTPSFLEFVMFSRMFVDSLDSLNHNNASENLTCLLGSSRIERIHCYCRVLELLVNVWSYHSARRMVYINPVTGDLTEQHALEHRMGHMWVRHFNFTLLKSMDEDLAEESDDGFPKKDKWLWPLTGEVHWQGIFEREREEKYRKKMDKHKKTIEKLIERQKYGYKQKALGG